MVMDMPGYQGNYWRRRRRRDIGSEALMEGLGVSCCVLYMQMQRDGAGSVCWYATTERQSVVQCTICMQV